MIPRRRGEHDRRERWLPQQKIATVPKTTPPATEPPPPRPAEPLRGEELVIVQTRVTRPRPRVGKLALIIVVVAAVIASRQLAESSSSAPLPQASLPSTPRQWVDQFATSILQSPRDVCSRLFARQLSAAYSTRGTNCVTFFTHARSTPFGVRRILEDGATAVLELRQALQGGYWEVVLNRDDGGWRAVDLVGGTTSGKRSRSILAYAPARSSATVARSRRSPGQGVPRFRLPSFAIRSQSRPPTLLGAGAELDADTARFCLLVGG